MTSKEPTILLEKRDGIAYITFNRPEKMNAIRRQEYNLYLEHLANCEKDDDVRVIIVTGKGRAWTVGDDMSLVVDAFGGNPLEIGAKRIKGQLSDFAHEVHRAWWTLMNSGKVSIAAVNGYCYTEFTWVMDYVIAADVAQFFQGDLRSGVSPGFSNTLATKVLGRRRALQVLLTADFFSAQEAYRIGLANKVVPLEQLMPEAEALAKKVMKYPLTAIKCLKMSVTDSQDLPTRQSFKNEMLYSDIASMSGEYGKFGKEWGKRKVE